MIKLVVFDFDDTLFHTSAVHAKSYASATLEVAHLQIPFERIEQRIRNGYVYPELLQSIAPGLPLDVYDEIHKNKNDIFAKSLNAIPVNYEVVDLLPSISARYLTAIWSNSSRFNIDMLLSEWNISEFFNQICSRENMKVAKPDVGSYKKLCAELKVSPQESLLIDDSSINIQAISETGALGILPRINLLANL